MRKPFLIVALVGMTSIAIATWMRRWDGDSLPVSPHNASIVDVGDGESPTPTYVAEPSVAMSVTAKSQEATEAPAVREESAPTNADDPNSRLERLLKRQQTLLKDPAYREAQKKKRFTELASTRPDLATVLQITQEQADALLLLVVEEELRFAEEAAPNPKTDKEMQARQLELQRRSEATDADIIALVGESAARKWKQYEASFGARQVVNELRSALAASPDPLRDEQVEALVMAIHDEQAALGAERRTLMMSVPWTPEMDADSRRISRDHFVQSADASNKRIHEAASSILSNRQLGHLDELLEAQLEKTRARIRLEQAEAKVQRR